MVEGQWYKDVRVFLLVSAFVLLTLGLNCGSSETTVVGKWQLVNDDELVEFYNDGTAGFANLGPFDLSGEGTYALIDKSHMRISRTNFLGGQDSETYEFKIEGDRLTLVTLEGVSSQYERIR